MPPLSRRSFAPRKLLVAAIGVATINYAAACSNLHNETAGNLPAPEPHDASTTGFPPTSGNLPAPQPMDANVDADGPADAGDAGDAGDTSDTDSG